MVENVKKNKKMEIQRLHCFRDKQKLLHKTDYNTNFVASLSQGLADF